MFLYTNIKTNLFLQIIKCKLFVAKKKQNLEKHLQDKQDSRLFIIRIG